MRIYIGPYRRGITFGVLGRWLRRLGVSNDWIDDLDGRLRDGWIGNARAWIQNRTLRHRTTRIRRAAEQGDPDGQFKLGRMYANGSGIQRDDVEAARW